MGNAAPAAPGRRASSAKNPTTSAPSNARRRSTKLLEAPWPDDGARASPRVTTDAERFLQDAMPAHDGGDHPRQRSSTRLQLNRPLLPPSSASQSSNDTSRDASTVFAESKQEPTCDDEMVRGAKAEAVASRGSAEQRGALAVSHPFQMDALGRDEIHARHISAQSEDAQRIVLTGFIRDAVAEIHRRDLEDADLAVQKAAKAELELAARQAKERRLALREEVRLREAAIHAQWRTNQGQEILSRFEEVDELAQVKMSQGAYPQNATSHPIKFDDNEFRLRQQAAHCSFLENKETLLVRRENILASINIAYFGLNRKHFEAFGGVKGVNKIAMDFYSWGVFCSPILEPLFVIKDAHHAQTLALFLMHFMGVSDEYLKKRRDFSTLHHRHESARFNPYRDKCPVGTGTGGGNWTLSQRAEWTKHFLWSCERNKVGPETLADVAVFIERMMEIYGPFADDRPF